ncbi:hypothetical protein G6F63_016839 [Rhizopus arrhizus]|nr:hypothetical protein G6F63_016839 [Rhizopus arrhizus]
MREGQAALHHVGLERQQAMPREQAVQGADRDAAGGRHRCGRQGRGGNRRIDVALDADEAQFGGRGRRGLRRGRAMQRDALAEG